MIGVTPPTWDTVHYEKLLRAFLLLIVFFSISRPSEALYTNSTENESWEIITTGLRWGDVTLQNTNKPYIEQCLRITIH